MCFLKKWQICYSYLTEPSAINLWKSHWEGLANFVLYIWVSKEWVNKKFIYFFLAWALLLPKNRTFNIIADITQPRGDLCQGKANVLTLLCLILQHLFFCQLNLEWLFRTFSFWLKGINLTRWGGLDLLRSYKCPSKYAGLSGEYLRKVSRYSMFFCNPGDKKPESLLKNLK